MRNVGRRSVETMLSRSQLFSEEMHDRRWAKHRGFGIGGSCQCDGAVCDRFDSNYKRQPMLRYICAKCGKSVPWCFGAADQHYHLCDRCAVGAEVRS